MPISYFDKPENNAGTLASRLELDSYILCQLITNTIGINIQNSSAFLCGIIIALIACWQLTLVSLALAPIMVVSGLIQIKFMQGFSSETDAAYKDSGNLIMESVNNVRTVVSFGNQDIIM